MANVTKAVPQNLLFMLAGMGAEVQLTVFSEVHTILQGTQRKGQESSPKALSILTDSAAPFTTILVQGTSLSNLAPLVVLSIFADLHLQ